MAWTELELEPFDEPNLKATAKTPTVRTALGKSNRMLLGQASVRRITQAEFGLGQAQIDAHIRGGFDVLAVELDLSFVPDFGCRFLNADFSLALRQGDGDPGPEPIVCELAPREVARTREYKRSSETGGKVGGEVSPGLGKLIAELNAKTTVEHGGTVKVRDIYGFGLNFSEAGWRFCASETHDLAGIYGPLTLVVRKPATATLFGEVRLAAEIAIEDVLDRWSTAAWGLSRRSQASLAAVRLWPAAEDGP